MPSPSFGTCSIIFVLLSSTSLSFAVDRSKFRTCTQTSFCRRHRFQKPKIQYSINDLKSIKYQPCQEKKADKNEEENIKKEEQPPQPQEEKKTSFWRKMFSGGSSGSNKNNDVVASTSLYGSKENDICNSNYLGPKPIFHALLNPSYKSSHVRELQLTVHVHSNGVFRIRITDPNDLRYVTDSFVLNEEEMQSIDVQNNLNYFQHQEELSVFLNSLGISDNSKNVAEKYRGFQTSVEGERYSLLIQLQPELTISYYQNEKLALSLNSQSMLYFEQLRSKKDQISQQESPEKVVNSEEEEESQQEVVNSEEDRHKGKEIVGYWEDGLAIYADGTREEKTKAPEEETATKRQLTETEEEDTQGLFEEHFSTHVDTKPFGPTSVGSDVTFYNVNHIYGIPEHASSMTLKSTTGEGSYYSEPYRLYNLDVFEYELDETMALYGHIPFMIGHGLDFTSGVFWFNPTETFVDIQANSQQNLQHETHWMSESGVFDVFLFSSTSIPSFYSKYATLTGRLYLPPMFSLGYHQCRWNYKDEKDVYFVHSQFEKYDYPYDVLWLDIEHTNGKRYFTWDKNLFPNPKTMIEKLASEGRKMVTIVDPHIKRDDNYYVHKTATKLGYYIKDKDGKKDYDGWCWPGSSSYLDFTSEKVREWFAEQFKYTNYEGSTSTLHTWNDMNEPSVFNGPEVSMSKDLLNLQGIEHRQWHNIYGMLFHRSTLEGLIKRNDDQNTRGFVLSRSFFAGSQKYGAIWTGDNTAKWDHLEISNPMLLSMNIAGFSFIGADVGGFFQNPSEELEIRWNQAGAYQPFFRGHAHHDTKRREPWVWGDETLKILRSVTMERYALLPFWYTVFYHGVITGMPVMRPMWMEFPNEHTLFATDDQYMIGPALLVKPITAPNELETKVSFPLTDYWYDARSMQKVQLAYDHLQGVEEITVSAPLHIIPVYQRGGTIIPRKLRLRRSTEAMKFDPYTLYIALNKDGSAYGETYLDDETTFDYQHKQVYCVSKFTYSADTLMNLPVEGSGWDSLALKALYPDNYLVIERIFIMGIKTAPKKVVILGKEATFEYMSEVLILRKPMLLMDRKWSIEIVI